MTQYNTANITFSLHRAANKLDLSIHAIVSLHHASHWWREIVLEDHFTGSITTGVNLYNHQKGQLIKKTTGKEVIGSDARVRSRNTLTFPLDQPVMSSTTPSPLRSKAWMLIAWFFDYEKKGTPAGIIIHFFFFCFSQH